MPVAALVIVVVAVLAVFGSLRVSMRLVGEVAEEFGEDPARWRTLMLPFGLFGPVICRFLLTRRGGGGGGFA
jgi:hypothetical protein